MIILAGKPGAGKGTQLELLQQRQGYRGVSVGAALRAASQHDPKIAELQRKGILVSTEVAGKVVEAAIEQAGTTKIILDGFPRNTEQTDWLKRYLEKLNDKVLVLILDVDDSEISRRLAQRGRVDDHPDTLRDRLKLYAEETLPNLKGLGERYQVIHIDGEGNKEVVYERVLQALNEAKL